MNIGYLYAIFAYILWGLLPLFWKSIRGIPALEILLHRITWSLVFLGILLLIKKDIKWIRKVLKNKKVMTYHLVSSLLLSANWFTYIWAVNSGHIVESSLGYFLNPLIYIILGRIFLKETINKNQLIAIIIASIGLLYLTFIFGNFPWIAIVLALTFGFYGLMKKQSSLNSIRGLSVETSLVAIPSILLLGWMNWKGIGHFGHTTISNNVLLISSGIATSVPLLFFAGGAQRISLVNLGFIQYIAPTIQFLIGVLIYKESFDSTKFIGFLFIWTALVIYTIDSYKRWKRNKLLSNQ